MSSFPSNKDCFLGSYIDRVENHDFSDVTNCEIPDLQGLPLLPSPGSFVIPTAAVASATISGTLSCTPATDEPKIEDLNDWKPPNTNLVPETVLTDAVGDAEAQVYTIDRLFDPTIDSNITAVVDDGFQYGYVIREDNYNSCGEQISSIIDTNTIIHRHVIDQPEGNRNNYSQIFQDLDSLFWNVPDGYLKFMRSAATAGQFSDSTPHVEPDFPSDIANSFFRDGNPALMLPRQMIGLLVLEDCPAGSEQTRFVTDNTGNVGDSAYYNNSALSGEKLYRSIRYSNGAMNSKVFSKGEYTLFNGVMTHDITSLTANGINIALLETYNTLLAYQSAIGIAVADTTGKVNTIGTVNEDYRRFDAEDVGNLISPSNFTEAALRIYSGEPYDIFEDMATGTFENNFISPVYGFPSLTIINWLENFDSCGCDSIV